MTDLDIAQLKMRLLEAQMALLQYQARDIKAEIDQLTPIPEVVHERL